MRDGRQQEGLGVPLQEDEERRSTSGSAAGVSNQPTQLLSPIASFAPCASAALSSSHPEHWPYFVASISRPGAETWKEGLEERRGVEKAKMLEAGKENIS